MNTKELIRQKIEKKLKEIIEIADNWDEEGYISNEVESIKELLEIMESLNE